MLCSEKPSITSSFVGAYCISRLVCFMEVVKSLIAVCLARKESEDSSGARRSTQLLWHCRTTLCHAVKVYVYLIVHNTMIKAARWRWTEPNQILCAHTERSERRFTQENFKKTGLMSCRYVSWYNFLRRSQFLPNFTHMI